MFKKAVTMSIFLNDLVSPATLNQSVDERVAYSIRCFGNTDPEKTSNIKWT